MGSIWIRGMFGGDIGGTGAERLLKYSEFCDGGTGSTVCAPDSVQRPFPIAMSNQLYFEPKYGEYRHVHQCMVRSITTVYDHAV